MPDHDLSGGETSFAKELYFPDDQIVIFPSSMGFSGEMNRTKGIKFDNNHGQLIKKEKEE